jgi:hypothetical protein
LTPIVGQGWDQDDLNESYDLGLLLSAADRLLARQHLLPPALPPDLDLILSSFDFRIGGDARELERRVQDEADALERGNAWALLHVEMEHPAIGAAVSKALAELDHVQQDYLNPYSDALVGMGADVRAIEARNRTGGVVGDNMTRLLEETQKMLDKLRLPEGLVETLRAVDLSDDNGRERALRFAEVLWKRMAGPWDGWEGMRAVKEKRSEWAMHVAEFSLKIGKRVSDDADRAVASHLTRFKGDEAPGRKQGPLRLPVPGLAEMIARHRPLLGWVREADPRGHYEILGFYVDKVGAVYDREIRRFAGEVRGAIGGRPRGYSELHLMPCTVFLANPYQPTVFAPETMSPSSPQGGISLPGNLNLMKTSTAIKDFSATLSRKTVEGIKDTSGNLLATFKIRGSNKLPDLSGLSAMSAGSSPRASMDTDREKDKILFEEDEGMPGEEAVDAALAGILAPLAREQNFIGDMFDLDGKRDPKTNEADGKAAKRDLKWQRRMAETMDRLVPSLVPELLLLLETSMKRDPTSSLGVLVVLEKHQQRIASEHASSHWMVGVLHKVMERARVAFIGFCEAQAGVVDGTKLLARKKLGTLDFTKTFPVRICGRRDRIRRTDG